MLHAFGSKRPFSYDFSFFALVSTTLACRSRVVIAGQWIALWGAKQAHRALDGNSAPGAIAVVLVSQQVASCFYHTAFPLQRLVQRCVWSLGRCHCQPVLSREVWPLPIGVVPESRVVGADARWRWRRHG
jgi:hypothetical protein